MSKSRTLGNPRPKPAAESGKTPYGWGGLGERLLAIEARLAAGEDRLTVIEQRHTEEDAADALMLHTEGESEAERLADMQARLDRDFSGYGGYLEDQPQKRSRWYRAKEWLWKQLTATPSSG